MIICPYCGYKGEMNCVDDYRLQCPECKSNFYEDEQ